MLGSHDTFTYLDSEDWFTRLLKPFWKCQSLSIQEQYDKGVRFFDIRVSKNYKSGLISKIFNRKDNNPYWSVSHGIAELEENNDFMFKTIEDICMYFTNNFKDAYYRIIFESGNEEEKQEFKQQIIGLENKYFGLCWYGIKKPWITLFYNPPFTYIEELNCKLFNWDIKKSFLTNIKKIKLNNTIKRWAKSNNPKITKEITEDKDRLVFIDYIGIEKGES